MNAGSEASIDARRHSILARCVKEPSHVRRPSIREKLGAMLEQAPDAWLDSPMDVYGGGIVAALESQVADLLGKPAAAFFPTGIWLFGKWREVDGEALSMTEPTNSASAMEWTGEEVRSAAGAFIERVARA